MTALQLALRLLWLILTRQIRHDRPVAREYGEWNPDGSSNYKRIYFADAMAVRFCPISKFDVECDAKHGSLTHQMYRHQKHCEGPLVEILALD